MAYIPLDTPRATDPIWTAFTKLAGDVEGAMRHFLANRKEYAAF